MQMLKVPIQPKDFPYLASRSPEVYEGDQVFLQSINNTIV